MAAQSVSKAAEEKPYFSNALRVRRGTKLPMVRVDEVRGMRARGAASSGPRVAGLLLGFVVTSAPRTFPSVAPLLTIGEVIRRSREVHV